MKFSKFTLIAVIAITISMVPISCSSDNYSLLLKKHFKIEEKLHKQVDSCADDNG